VGSKARAANLRPVAPGQRSGIAIASANAAVMRAAGTSTAGWQGALSEPVTAGAAVGIAQWVRFGPAEQQTRGGSQA
jgi:hypothetical protein